MLLLFYFHIVVCLVRDGMRTPFCVLDNSGSVWPDLYISISVVLIFSTGADNVVSCVKFYFYILF